MSLGLQTAGAIRSKLWRSNESPQRRQQRLERDRERHAAARATESDERRQQRIAQNRARLAAESHERRQQRLAQSRARNAAARAVESDERRLQRLAQSRARMTAARAAESDERRQQRLAQSRARMSAARAAESDERRQQRLAQVRARNAAARAAKKRNQELPQIQDEESVPRRHSFLASVCDSLEEAGPVDIKVEVVNGEEEYAIVSASMNDRPSGDNRQCGSNEPANPLKRSDVCQKTALSNQAPSHGRYESGHERQQKHAPDREHKAEHKRDQSQEKRLRIILHKLANKAEAATDICWMLLRDSTTEQLLYNLS